MPSPLARRELAALLGCAGLLLVGWSSLLLPSMVRSIESTFGQTDAGIGTYFFVNSLAYVAGSMGGGFLTERLGRRVVLSVAALLLAAGLTMLGTVSSWELMILAAVPLGIGGGALDGGPNGLFLDLYPASRGRALNLLHLCFSLGALASPLVAGRLVEAGVPWQSIFVGTALVALPMAVLLAVVPMPSGRHKRVPAAEAGGGATRIGLAWPMVGLAVAIACYVAAEIGVSNWLVRFLESATVGLATAALSLFWGSLALGRLASARWSDRFDHARFASVAAVGSAFALLGAVVVPSLELSIVLFAVAGFAFGPVYPLIMAVAGDRYPTRSAAVSGFLSGCAVIGSIAYPPLMGFMSVTIGLGPAMAGAAALAFAAGVALWLVGRARTAEAEARAELTGPKVPEAAV
jgi:FHS family glucose/mannose:H+ symporter-like MFS transporter